MTVYKLTATPVVIELRRPNPPIAIVAKPTAGDTVAVEFDYGSGTWLPWDPGPVTGVTQRCLIAPIPRMRATRTAGTGLAEIEVV